MSEKVNGLHNPDVVGYDGGVQKMANYPMKSVSMKSKCTFSTIALVGVNNKAKHLSCDACLALSEQVDIKEGLIPAVTVVV